MINVKWPAVRRRNGGAAGGAWGMNE